MSASLRKSVNTIFAIQLALVAVLMIFSVLLVDAQKLLNRSRDTQMNSYALADELRQSSDDLTRFARAYVATGDPTFERKYWEVLGIREGSHPRPAEYNRIFWDLVLDPDKPPRSDGESISLRDLMVRAGFTKEEFGKLSESQRMSNELVLTEQIAMNAIKGLFADDSGKFTIVAAPDFILANRLMNDDNYYEQKAAIMRPIDEFYDLFVSRTSAEVEKCIESSAHVLWSIFMISVGILGMLVFSLFTIHRQIREREQAEHRFRESNAVLRSIVFGTTDIVYVKDLNGNYTLFNSAFEKCARRDTSSGLKTDDPHSPLPECEGAACNNRSSETEASLTTTDEEVLLDASGKCATYLSTKGPVVDSHNEVIGMFCISRNVTSLKKLENELLKLKLGIERCSDAIFMTDTNGVIVYANQAFQTIYGYTLEETLGKTPRILKSGRLSAIDYEAFWNTLLSKQSVSAEIFNKTSNGDILNMQVSANPVLDDRGNIIAFLAIQRDITQHKQMQETLRASEYFFRQSQRAARIGSYEAYFVIDHWDSSEVLDEIFGIDRNYKRSVQGWIDIIHPDDRDMMAEYLRQDVIAKRKPFLKEYRIIRQSDRELRWVLGSGEVACDAEGNVVSLIGTIQDVTERKLEERALQVSEHRLQNIVDNIFDVIVTYNLDLIITYASPSFSDTFGYLPEELIGHGLTNITLEAERCIFESVFDPTLSRRNRIDKSLHITKRDGTIADIEMNITPIVENGVIAGGQAIIRDVTEAKRLRALESRGQRLETAGIIAGQVAHDFNNLLSPILTYPEFIREDLPADHPAHSCLDQIENAARKMADINQDLLTLGRRGYYSQAVINLNHIVAEVIRSLPFEPGGTLLETDLSPDLMNIKGGPGQLFRVILNLIVNAKDATRGTGRISIMTENYYSDDSTVAYDRVPKGEYVKLTIADTGCGIPKDALEKIFDPFFSTKDANKERGSGLGLSVVATVVKDHNGYLDLSSEPGRGTSFYLYFPITRESVNTEPLGEVSGGEEKVLIVDDDEIQREVATKILTKLGYRVSTVGSGEEAIELLKKAPQDILILDMIMSPGIDGTETYRRAIQINPNQRAIIVSGFAETARASEAMKLGCGSFVRKPMSGKVVARAVREELDRKAVEPVV